MRQRLQAPTVSVISNEPCNFRRELESQIRKSTARWPFVQDLHKMVQMSTVLEQFWTLIPLSHNSKRNQIRCSLQRAFSS